MFSAQARILPYIDQANLQGLVDFSLSPYLDSEPNTFPNRVVANAYPAIVPVLLGPSDRGLAEWTANLGPTLTEVDESTISAADVIYGEAAANHAWLVRTGRVLLGISQPIDNSSKSAHYLLLHRTRRVFSMHRLRRLILLVLTYDFCPWANRWVYWVKQPTACLGLTAVVALACALFVKPIALIAFAAVLLILLLGYMWPSMAVRGLSCTVRFRQERVTEGEPVYAEIEVRNRWPWPVWGIAVEGDFGTDATVALARVAGWSTAEFEWSFVPDCRGEYPTEAPSLVTGFPFGLRHARRPVAIERTILVWPRIMSLETLLDAAETRPSDDLFSDRRVGDSGDMTGTRGFREGDSLRRVHWAQTARQGQLIVCERQATAQSAIRVVFDSDPRLHSGHGRDSTLEWSIRIAASVCAAYHRENAHVECCFGHEILPLSAGRQGWKRFLDALARWKPCERKHGTGCEHEHSQRHCRRIHHHNCGVFQLTITTDLGLEHRTEHRHVHGDHRLVVLKSSAFAEACSMCNHEHHAPSRRAIVLDRPADVAADFPRKWRHACHAG